MKSECLHSILRTPDGQERRCPSLTDRIPLLRQGEMSITRTCSRLNWFRGKLLPRNVGRSMGSEHRHSPNGTQAQNGQRILRNQPDTVLPRQTEEAFIPAFRRNHSKKRLIWQSIWIQTLPCTTKDHRCCSCFVYHLDLSYRDNPPGKVPHSTHYTQVVNNWSTH